MGWRAVERGGQITSEWEMPENEAAWHRNSARPGEGHNVVISGHNASIGGQVFAELDELQIGDEIVIWNDQDEAIAYHVVEKNIIRLFLNSAEGQDYLKTVTEETNQEQLTLITCWPRWSNTHRLVIIAAPMVSM
jgi:sortase A